jgi:hypothetical protein
MLTDARAVIQDSGAALDETALQQIAAAVPGGRANIQHIYPLTPLQAGMVSQHVLRGEADPYLVLTLLECQSAETVRALITAFQLAIDRHDTLRTAIIWQDLPAPMQVVYRSVRLLPRQLDPQPGLSIREQMLGRMQPEFHRLDLTRAPLIQLHVAADRQPGGKHYVLLVLHHLICDIISFETLIAEVVTRIRTPDLELGPAQQFRDYVARALERPATAAAEEYFKRTLADFRTRTTVFAAQHGRGGPSRMRECQQPLPPDLGDRLRAAAGKLRVSPAAVFHAACAMVIARMSGRDDVVFGSVFSGRLRAGTAAKDTIGMFINTLPLRLQLADLTVQNAVRQTHRRLLELMRFEQTELSVAQRCSGIAGSAPLFCVLLNYVRRPKRNDTGWGDADTGIRMLVSSAWTDYPVTLVVDDFGDEFSLVSQTAADADSQRVLEYVLLSVEALVRALEISPERSIGAVRREDLERIPVETAATALAEAGADDPQPVRPPYEPPQGNTEERLAAIWSATLKVENVGRNESFFALGGHSLLGFQLLSAVAAHFQVHAPSISIFRCPTVSQMARFIETLSARAQPDLEEGVI